MVATTADSRSTLAKFLPPFLRPAFLCFLRSSCKISSGSLIGKLASVSLLLTNGLTRSMCSFSTTFYLSLSSSFNFFCCLKISTACASFSWIKLSCSCLSFSISCLSFAFSWSAPSISTLYFQHMIKNYLHITKIFKSKR